jgi:hypothetical protein
MKIGTRSILYGVHQFLFHPLTVAMAWRRIYGEWPRWHEWVAIFCHDLGYIGCPDMDGEIGQQHPLKGAELTQYLVFHLRGWWLTLRHPIRSYFDYPFQLTNWCAANRLALGAYNLALGHSRFYAEKHNIDLSQLFRADKLCVRYDPPWFYLLRGSLTGEVKEFIARSKTPKAGRWEWYKNYRIYVEEKFK